MSNTRIEWRASAISSSIAATCSRTVPSASLPRCRCGGRVRRRRCGGNHGDTNRTGARARPRQALAIARRRQCAGVGEPAQRRAAGSRPAQRLAVDVKAARVVEELRSQVEAHARASRSRDERRRDIGGSGGVEVDRRFRFGEQRAHEAVDVGAATSGCAATIAAQRRCIAGSIRAGSRVGRRSGSA